jgi:hypothetical protein
MSGSLQNNAHHALRMRVSPPSFGPHYLSAAASVGSADANADADSTARFWLEHGTTDTREGRAQLLHLLSQSLHAISLREKDIEKRMHLLGERLSHMHAHVHGDATDNMLPTQHHIPPFTPLFSTPTWTQHTRAWLLKGNTNTHEGKAHLLDIIADYLQMIDHKEQILEMLMDTNEDMLTSLLHHSSSSSTTIPHHQHQHHHHHSLFTPERWSHDTSQWLHSADTEEAEDPRAGRAELLSLLHKYLTVIGQRETLFDSSTSNHEKLLADLLLEHSLPMRQ